MISHAKIIELLTIAADELSRDSALSLDILFPFLDSISSDRRFLSYIENRFDVPLLLENAPCTQIYPIHAIARSYCVLGIDGSQIYPDRHSGINCFLLNIGTILIEYGSLHGRVSRKSEPFLFPSFNTFHDTVHSHDIVDAERFIKELEHGFEVAYAYKKEKNSQIIVLIDGPLLFWHVAQKPTEFQNHYTKRYLKIFELYKNAQIPLVGYTSMPRSKELIHILKAYLEYAQINDKKINEISSKLIDTQLISLFLKENHRSILFQSQHTITNNNPDDQKICFIYMNTGAEYVRIEIPQWIARDEIMREFVYTITMHQIKNGFGYPTVLALAHEQAVVKGSDRAFFIKMLQKTVFNNQKTVLFSQKQIKKDS